MATIKGIQVLLKEKAFESYDEFNHPIFNINEVTIDNVVVSPLSYDEIVNELTISGRKAEYTLHIPKGDEHNWEDAEVEFFGKTFKTFGPVIEYIEELVPLDWNKKVKVCRIE